MLELESSMETVRAQAERAQDQQDAQHKAAVYERDVAKLKQALEVISTLT